LYKKIKTSHWHVFYEIPKIKNLIYISENPKTRRFFFSDEMRRVEYNIWEEDIINYKAKHKIVHYTNVSPWAWFFKLLLGESKYRPICKFITECYESILLKLILVFVKKPTWDDLYNKSKLEKKLEDKSRFYRFIFFIFYYFYDLIFFIKKILIFIVQFFFFFKNKLLDYLGDIFYSVNFRSSVAKGDYFFPLLDYFDALFFRLYSVLNDFYEFLIFLRKLFIDHIKQSRISLNLHYKYEFNFSPYGRKF
jgi:hypothetical protein